MLPRQTLYIFFKSTFDRLVALVMLILLSPLFLLIALWIKRDSKGPVFFLQERLGKNGKVFKIYKFRTMVDNAINMGTGLHTAESNDPRITRSGRFLRRSSLDELPQLINILRGEMSFIGPRPPVPYSPCLYEEYDDDAKKRFDVKPGISGYAQVVFRKNSTWKQRFVYDVMYVEKIGFFLDVRLVFLTFFKILSAKGIYADPALLKEKTAQTNAHGCHTDSADGNKKFLEP